MSTCTHVPININSITLLSTCYTTVIHTYTDLTGVRSEPLWMPIDPSHSYLALMWWDMHKSSRQFCRQPVSLYHCLARTTVCTLQSTWPSMTFFKYTYYHPHLKFWLPALSSERFTSTCSLFYVWLPVHLELHLYNKPTRCTIYLHFIELPRLYMFQALDSIQAHRQMT
jgi:hypothetical protein